jgi:hypothetical protein
MSPEKILGHYLKPNVIYWSDSAVRESVSHALLSSFLVRVMNVVIKHLAFPFKPPVRVYKYRVDSEIVRRCVRKTAEKSFGLFSTDGWLRPMGPMTFRIYFGWMRNFPDILECEVIDEGNSTLIVSRMHFSYRLYLGLIIGLFIYGVILYGFFQNPNLSNVALALGWLGGYLWIGFGIFKVIYAGAHERLALFVGNEIRKHEVAGGV